MPCLLAEKRIVWRRGLPSPMTQLRHGPLRSVSAGVKASSVTAFLREVAHDAREALAVVKVARSSRDEADGQGRQRRQRRQTCHAW